MNSEESVPQGLQNTGYFIMHMCTVHCKEAGVLRKLSLAGLAIVDSESTIGRCTQPANSQLIPKSKMKYLGFARFA